MACACARCGGARGIVLKALFKSFFSRGAKRDGHAAGALALAKDLQKKGEPHAAIAAYREALEHGAPAAPIHLQLGVLHASLSEQEHAIEHLEKATQNTNIDGYVKDCQKLLEVARMKSGK